MSSRDNESSGLPPLNMSSEANNATPSIPEEDFPPPPNYSESAANQPDTNFILPTYEEAERTKDVGLPPQYESDFEQNASEEAHLNPVHERDGRQAGVNRSFWSSSFFDNSIDGVGRGRPRLFFFGTRGISDNPLSDEEEAKMLGTDMSFFIAFLVGVIFNWLGFLVVLCLVPNIAARCGALAGFGLSLAKWVALVHHKRWMHSQVHSDSWVWWIFILFGILISVRGAWHYLILKRKWATMSSSERKEAYYFY